MNGMEMQAPRGDIYDVFGWAVVVIGTIATIYTFAACVYWVVRPGEMSVDHPKRIIMRDDR